MKHKLYITLFLILSTGVLYYKLTEPSTQTQTIPIVRVIDGDTLVLENNIKTRLKGINAPEKSMPYFNESKTFLSSFTNSSLQIQNTGADKYNRLLVYVYYNNQLLNELIIQKGFAHLYYYEKDEHYKTLEQAEQEARENQRGMWKPSPNSACVELIELEHDEPESLTLQNNCNKIINITIKDEATHIYHETLQPNSQFTKNFSHIWNTGGDSLFVWDEQGLVLFYRY